MNLRMCLTKNKREIAFPFCHECRTKKQVYYFMRNRVSDICIPRLRSTAETLRWVRPWSGWNLHLSDFFLFFFFNEFKPYNLLVLFIYSQETDLKNSKGLKTQSKMPLRTVTAFRKHTEMHTHPKVIWPTDYFQRINHTFYKFIIWLTFKADTITDGTNLL